MIVDWPGVSVVIAHKDHAEALLQNLESMLKQDYPLFEIIVVDDHSDAGNFEKLKHGLGSDQRVKLIQNAGVGKKQALKEGIYLASHPLIMMTDADCKPITDQWIRSMVLAGGKQGVVLGYSPYEKTADWLNAMVRFETVMTGIQYISTALHGRPYMSVGRNILYPKYLIAETLGQGKFENLPYGDDDLTIQSLPEEVAYFVCYERKAHVVSDAPATWSAWWNQKHRHMSAGHHYQKKHWWRPGIFGIALVIHWVLFFVLLVSLPLSRFIPVFLIGLGIRWLGYVMWTSSLGDKDTIRYFPFLEIQYAIYLGVMGMYTLFNKKKTWN